MNNKIDLNRENGQDQIQHNPVFDVISTSSKTINLVIGMVALFLAPLLWTIGLVDESAHLYKACDQCYMTHHLALSVSHYYCWTNITRNLFVGLLSGVGLLFMAYRGWTRRNYTLDRTIGSICGICAFTIANFPTNSALHLVHYIAACLLFVLLSFIASCRFTDFSHDPDENHLWKPVRNGIYRLSGAIMIIGMVMCFGQLLINEWLHATFYGEMTALSGFGIAWLTKSRILFGYKKQKAHFLYYREGWEKSPIARVVAKLNADCLLCKKFTKRF